ncbi:MAG: hypothetical protein AAGD32_17590 [Planctomycetota bacterium]
MSATAAPDAPTAQQHFSAELGWITDEELRGQVSGFIDGHAPDYFWTRPASKSGRFHPDVSRGNGGLIRHTKLVARAAREVARAYYPLTPNSNNDVIPFYNDTLISAALMHDMFKDGDPTVPGTTYKMHGKHVMDRIGRELFEGRSDAVTNEWRYIMFMVATHMGRWTEQHPFRPSSLTDPDLRRACEMFTVADYTASWQWDQWYAAMAVAS